VALYDIVIPTIGRPSLGELLGSLADLIVPPRGRIIVVDDRSDAIEPLSYPHGLWHDDDPVEILRGGGRGPAAARNVGWRAATAAWVVFLDDDVRVPRWWSIALERDLRGMPSDFAASQGRIRVPVPLDRRPTDWERNVAGLEGARWATADMAYRRAVLERVDGFDERFPRAYREDADIALRVLETGSRIVQGSRVIQHPIRPADRWVSVRLQRGNEDDALMSTLHGSAWREAAGAPRGRRVRHAVVVAFALVGAAAALARSWGVAVAFGMAWAAGTAELAWARIAPGPRSPSEIWTMVITSVAIPWAAVAHWMRGSIRARLATHRRVAMPLRSSGPWR
jgi:Glycosyl transferase family 2